jgi:hypothetical protein
MDAGVHFLSLAVSSDCPAIQPLSQADVAGVPCRGEGGSCLSTPTLPVRLPVFSSVQNYQ